MTRSTPQGNDIKEKHDSGKAIGATLRAARLDSGMSVADISHTIRISKDFVKMLEAGEFGALPSPTYVAGYIRSYGAAVGIEPKAVALLVTGYYAQLEEGAATPSYRFPLGDQRPRRSGALAASIAVLVAIGGYTGWYLMDRPQTIEDVLTKSAQTAEVTPEIESTMTESGALGGGADARLDQIVSLDEEGDGDALPEVEIAQSEVQPDNFVDVPLIDDTQEDSVNLADMGTDAGEALPMAPATSTSTSTSSVTATARAGDVMVEADLAQIDPVAAEGSAGSETGEQTATSLGEEVQTASATTDVANEVPLAGGEITRELLPDRGSAIANQRDPANEVTLRARASSWVEIVRNDGEEVMTRLMRAGDTYLIDTSDSLYLSTGNAGGLEFVFNDGTVREVGDTGEIVRDLPLVISGLKAKL
jgi:cytoskeleton protein RodZ